MSTLADVTANVTNMLRRTGDTGLATPIQQEVQNAVRHYSRRPSFVIERRQMTIATVASQVWYSLLDNSSSAGFGDSATGTAPSATDSTLNLLKPIFAKVEQGAIDWPIEYVPYQPDFAALEAGAAITGIPSFWTFYAGRIGLYPTPAAVYTVYISGFFKPTVPTDGTHESAWFDQQIELIEVAAAKRVAMKWLHDTEMGMVFAQLEAEQESLLFAESAYRGTSGRVRKHD